MTTSLAKPSRRWARIADEVRSLFHEIESGEQDDSFIDGIISQLFNHFEEHPSDTGDPVDGLFATFHHPDGSDRRLILSFAAYLYTADETEELDDDDDEEHVI